MDQPLVPVNNQLVPAPGVLAGFAALPARSKMMLAAGIAALAAVAVALSLWGSQGDYKVLYANLSDKDGGAVIAQLSQMNIPYRHADGGSAILVPATQVYDARLKLAAAGLPKGSVAGFDAMDVQRFGQTQFQERLNFQRGLEGELTRTITSLSAVEGARVHLALPNQNGFFREQQKPSASVMLSLHAGRTLDRAQIAGIVHLVSSSVPELTPKAVSVVDQSGALLTTPDGASNNGLDAQQLQYVSQIENGFSKRIVDILEPVVGRENLRAQVTAEVDFAQTESTSEEYGPNQGVGAGGKPAPATIRSQQMNEQSGGGSGGGGAQATGVPGAASNQPPQAPSAPVTGAVQPLQTAQAGGGAGGGGGSSRREAVTNYEVDKTVRVTRNATGTVKRLNTAVVVNHRVSTDAKGKTTSTPLSPEELEKLTTLVREAVGYDEKRGDSVKVINEPFKIEKVETPSVPLWKQPETIDMLRGFAVPGAMVLVALLVMFGMIRPALKAALAPPQLIAPPRGAQVDQVIDDPHSLPAPLNAPTLPAPPNGEDRLASARAIAKQNPAVVAAVVRNWVSGEAGS